MTQEEQQQLLQRITYNPGIFGGKPIIRGMRFTVVDILELLSAGADEQEILEDFPFLESKDIQAALLYATLRLKNSQILSASASV